MSRFIKPFARQALHLNVCAIQSIQKTSSYFTGPQIRIDMTTTELSGTSVSFSSGLVCFTESYGTEQERDQCYDQLVRDLSGPRQTKL